MMAEQVRRYSFQPLERRGILLGLDAGQLALIAGGLVGALILRAAIGGLPGTVVAVVVVATGVVSAIWRSRSESIATWTHLGATWLARRITHRRLVSDVPLGGAVGTVAAGEGRASVGDATPKAARGGWAGHHRGLAPPAIELLDDRGVPGDAPLGVIRDRGRGRWAGVFAVRGRPYSLLDPSEQAGRLELWRGVLGALARPGSPIRLAQWVQRSAPAQIQGLYESMERIERARPIQLESYRELLDHAAPVLQGHDAWLVIAIEPAPGRGTGGRHSALGRSHRSAVATLRRELRLLDGQLTIAGLDPGRPLGLEELAAVLESGRGAARARPRADSGSTWPLAVEEHWGFVITDGTRHATYWVAEWPRIEVGPEFLLPLLLGSGQRTVSLLMSPLAADKALREVRSSRTADVADMELREKAGFLPSARRLRESEGAAQREAELADGHSEYRFSGYVTVSAGDADGLAAGCAEVEHAAQGCHIELRRLYGRQAEALTWTLPLARGLR